MILAAVDTLLLAALPRLGPFPDLALRIGFVPVTAAIAYELLRWGSRRRGLGFALNRFGLFTQRLTTARPDPLAAGGRRGGPGALPLSGSRRRACAGVRSPLVPVDPG